jgi:predicted deacylase
MREADRSRLIPEVDFEADGKQTGFIRLFHSVHASAYGFIPIPIVVIRNGAGPTASMRGRWRWPIWRSRWTPRRSGGG